VPRMSTCVPVSPLSPRPRVFSAKRVPVPSVRAHHVFPFCFFMGDRFLNLSWIPGPRYSASSARSTLGRASEHSPPTVRFDAQKRGRSRVRIHGAPERRTAHSRKGATEAKHEGMSGCSRGHAPARPHTGRCPWAPVGWLLVERASRPKTREGAPSSRSKKKGTTRKSRPQDDESRTKAGPRRDGGGGGRSGRRRAAAEGYRGRPLRGLPVRVGGDLAPRAWDRARRPGGVGVGRRQPGRRLLGGRGSRSPCSNASRSAWCCSGPPPSGRDRSRGRGSSRERRRRPTG